MGERFNFVGSQLTPHQKRETAQDLTNIRKENVFQKSELEKTPQEREAIALVDTWLKREFASLDIPEVPELKPERFHVMSEEWFDKEVKDENTLASYYTFEDAAVFSRGRTGTPLVLYQSIFHEAIHAASLQKHWVDGKENGVGSYRVGYRIQNLANDRHVHLLGLNEAVVETTTEEFVKRNAHTIVRRLGVSREELSRAEFLYAPFRMVLRELCEGVASFQGIASSEVWKKIKRGQFTGEMMHLRDIERAYGSGALRVLDALQVSTQVNQRTEDIQAVDEKNKKILEFFQSYDRDGENNESTRAHLAYEIVGGQG